MASIESVAASCSTHNPTQKKHFLGRSVALRPFLRVTSSKLTKNWSTFLVVINAIGIVRCPRFSEEDSRTLATIRPDWPRPRELLFVLFRHIKSSIAVLTTSHKTVALAAPIRSGPTLNAERWTRGERYRPAESARSRAISSPSLIGTGRWFIRLKTTWRQ